jgi:ketosteroid isomerase-like protein
MMANDPAVLGRLATDDVVLMPPHSQPVVGRQAVMDWFADVVRQVRTTDVVVPEREVTIAGDLAIERGVFTWKVVPTLGGSEIADRGNFLAAWQSRPTVRGSCRETSGTVRFRCRRSRNDKLHIANWMAGD